MCLAIGGVLILVLGAVGPLAIDLVVDSKVCDQVCIPTPDSEEWAREAWRTNQNRSRNPMEVRRYYVYNITNKDEMLNGSKPVLQMLGPYTYQMNREKYNISYNTDYSEVQYDVLSDLEFLPDLSEGNPDTDIIWSVNMPFLGAASLMNTYVAGNPEIPSTFVLFCEGPNKACLFTQRAVSAALFSEQSYILQVANMLYFNEEFFDQEFSLFLTEKDPDSHWEALNKHYYGMGGKCDTLRVAVFDNDFCRTPGTMNGTDLRWKQKTGLGDLKEVNQIVEWLGNSTLNMWATPLKIHGTDHYQFQNRVSKDDILTVFDDQAMRSVDAKYKEEVSLLDVDMWRFEPTADFLGGNDPQFFGNGIKGLMNASGTAEVQFGSPTPVFISNPYFFDGDESLFEGYECLNCPDTSNMTNADLGTFFDVEPNTGKVLRGYKRAQINALVGQDELFGNASEYSPDTHPWARIPLTYLPVLWFEEGAEMNVAQSHIVKDGLKLLDLADSVKLGLRIFGFTVGALMLLGGFYKFHVLQKETEVQSSYTENLINHQDVMQNQASGANNGQAAAW